MLDCTNHMEKVLDDFDAATRKNNFLENLEVRN
jgi:hypothetical protein